MRDLTLSEVLELHRRIIGHSGGSLGIRDLNAIESALAQPRMTFDCTSTRCRVLFKVSTTLENSPRTEMCIPSTCSAATGFADLCDMVDDPALALTTSAIRDAWR